MIKRSFLFTLLVLTGIGALAGGCTKILPTKRVVVDEPGILPEESEAQYKTDSGGTSQRPASQPKKLPRKR